MVKVNTLSTFLEEIDIAPSYISVLDKLTIPELTNKNGHSLQAFFGGPVIIGHRQHWLRPIFFEGFSVHVLYLNCSPDNLENPEVRFLRDDDIGFKLSDETIDSDKPCVFIRQCLSGNIMFPDMVEPMKNRPMSDIEFQKLHKILQLGNGPITTSLVDVPKYSPVLIADNVDGVYKIKETSYRYRGNRLYVADFILDNDPWKHYQLISRDGVDEYLSGHEKGTIVRIDSGCDSGQIYGDEACDCREQLHRGIDEMIKDNGIIIHIPTQDGRGYGCATKMETEGLKEGLLMKTNAGRDIRQMDTVEAGKHLFGEQYDIRTFHGSGRILHALGLSSIILLTNNRKKIDEIISAGIHVIPKDIKVDKPSCSRHTNAKYDTPHYT